VAFLYAPQWAQEKDVLIAFLDQVAATLSKKPLYLRNVLVQEVGADLEAKALADKLRGVRAVAVLAVLEGLPEAKLRELAEAFSEAGVMFRSVPPSEAQKKSLAVDIIVDAMLLPPET